MSLLIPIAIDIVWTENLKFRVFTNIYLQSARNLMKKEQLRAVAGYLDLNGKYSGQYPVGFDIKENPRVTLCL